MVTGPMPRNPKATKPNANTAGRRIMCAESQLADEVADGHQR